MADLTDLPTKRKWLLTQKARWSKILREAQNEAHEARTQLQAKEAELRELEKDEIKALRDA